MSDDQKMSDKTSGKNRPVIRIALDVMGGDQGPEAVIPGAALATKTYKNVEFLLFGRTEVIEPILSRYPDLQKRCTIHHTDTVVGGHERPSVALRAGRQSSMRLAIDAVAEGKADCVVSSGNTGALMAMAKLSLKCLPGIHRPAIASLLPTIRGSTMMLDLGANISCDAENLVQFAILGSVYAKAVLGIQRPTVGLLNVGSEDMKGHDTLREALAILSAIKFPGEFKGFVEGDDIGKGTVDVVVTDGFTGNIALKTAEGIAALFTRVLRKEFSRSLLGRLAYLASYLQFAAVKKRLDHRVYNGGLFLGLNGVCIKSHGSADAYAFSHAVMAGIKMVRNGFNPIVAKEIEALTEQESFISAANERVIA